MTSLDESVDLTPIAGQFDSALHQIELRHLRYFVAVAEAGTFTGAAEQVFVAQPTLSQQVRRLEDMIGTQLLERRRDGVRVTCAGEVLLGEARSVLSRVENGLLRARAKAGVGRRRLRLAVPPDLPEELVLRATTALAERAGLLDVDVAWSESLIDRDFTIVAAGHADAALGWWPGNRSPLGESLDFMTVGDFRPEVWVRAQGRSETVARFITAQELAHMDVFHGPRDQLPALYDVWEKALRSHRPDFAFRDPPFRRRWGATLATAGGNAELRAVLTGPERPVTRESSERAATATERSPAIVSLRPVGPELSATAVMVWSIELSRELQQLVFDVADTLQAAFSPLPAAATTLTYQPANSASP
jgi:DNA-binding transcriptional LysR family regulator